MSEQDRNNDYDSEPVVYCAKCLSLKIKHEDALDIDCCGNCGSTDVVESSIEIWEKKYEAKYGKKFTVKNDDPRNSPIFKLPINKLMAKVSDCPKWENIIKDIYSHFPKGISKADSIVMFFDKLMKDNKLESLRTLLYKMKI
jgi:hypothetical protein